MTTKDTKKRTILLPIGASLYQEYMENNDYAHEIIRNCYNKHHDLFPESMSKGYCLNGKTKISKKTNLQMRKIKIGKETYQLRPSYILPYQKGEVAEASKGLF